MPRRATRHHLDPSLIKLIHASLPRQAAKCYVQRLEHWQRTKGKEWLASRIKALWNMALLQRAGLHEQIPTVCRASRIGCDDSGYPRGLEGDMVRRFAKIQSPAKLRQASVAFRAYTALRLDETSLAQRTKAEESINTPPPDTDNTWVYCLPVVEPWVGVWPKAAESSEEEDLHRWLLTLPRSRKKIKFDSLTRLSGTSRYPGLLRIPGRDLSQKPFLSLVASLLTKGHVPAPLVEALGDWQLRQDAELFQRGIGDMSHGKISVIQEGGTKARVVASPNAWLQFYCYPYHRHLMEVIRALESGSYLPLGRQYGMGCCTCHTVGVSMALVALSEQRFCAAVDLSSATDRFPLGLQQRTCSLLGVYEFGQALSELKGPWVGLPKSTQTRWYYAAGQPMGLYGSFPLFHLTHFLLLNSLSAKLGLVPDGGNFAVLGDDVVLFNEELRWEYLRALESLGVSVSQHKCYEGDLVEFAGFVITKSRNSATAYRPYKASPDGNIMVLNVCHAIGSAVKQWSKWWSRAYDEYVATRGMRDLTLEPLYSDPEEPFKASGIPGSRWIGSCLNQAASYPLTRNFLTTSEVEVLWDRIQRHWSTERFTLLKEVELLMDIGSPGVTDPSLFDPQSYTQMENLRKTRNPFMEYGSDPLIRAHRESQEELQRLQLSD